MKVTLTREYYSLSDTMYRWVQQNAPDTSWDQMFGTTDLFFNDEKVALQFKKYMKRKLNENTPTK